MAVYMCIMYTWLKAAISILLIDEHVGGLCTSSYCHSSVHLCY